MKTIIGSIFLLIVLFASLGASELRTWKTIGGGHFEAKIKSVAATTVLLENSEGQTTDFPIADLMPSDQKYVREWLSEQAPAAESPAASAGHTEFAGKVYKNLVSIKGKRLARFEAAPGDKPKYFAFYFSAAWCPPCRKFTPKLVDFYNKQKQAGAAFELIFVSSDRSEDAMAEYMKDYRMKFPAFDFGKNKKLVTPNGGGIPNLIVTDAQGKKLLDSYNDDGKYIGPTKVLEELEKLLAD